MNDYYITNDSLIEIDTPKGPRGTVGPIGLSSAIYDAENKTHKTKEAALKHIIALEKFREDYLNWIGNLKYTPVPIRGRGKNV